MIKHNKTNKNVNANFWFTYKDITRRSFGGYKYLTHEVSNNITKFDNSELANAFTRIYN